MTTSGDTTWNYTRDQIISAAFRKIDVLNKGQTPEAADQTSAQEALNNIVYTLVAQGMPIWAISESSLTMIEGQRQYPIGIGTAWSVPAPLKILQAYNHDNLSDSDIPMNIYTQYNYNELTNKDTTGMPIQFWYQPLNQTGTITLWPTPDAFSATNRVIVFSFQRPFEGFDSSTDTPDFPQWWIEPLIYHLAHRLCPEYGVDSSSTDQLLQTANMLTDNALSFGTEEGSIFLQPDWTVYDMGQTWY